MDTITREQWEAARLLVGRMTCEANGIPFKYKDYGVEWLNAPEVICGITEKGVELTASDIITAAIILLWAMITEHADSRFDEPSDVVSELGLAVLGLEP